MKQRHDVIFFNWKYMLVACVLHNSARNSAVVQHSHSPAGETVN